MKQIDNDIRQALESSVRQIVFSRREAVRDVIHKQIKTDLPSKFRMYLKPITVGIVAFAIVVSVALSSITYVPSRLEASDTNIVMVAGDLPFAAIRYNKDARL